MADTVIDKFLQPGANHIAGKDTRIHTVLGSCVAIVVWHRASQYGGMCHFVLPEKRCLPRENLDGRYAGDALELLTAGFSRLGIKLHDCLIRLFGGGSLLNRSHQTMAIGQRNIAAAIALMHRHGLNLNAQHLGGVGYRKLLFDICNGDVLVWMNRVSINV